MGDQQRGGLGHGGGPAGEMRCGPTGTRRARGPALGASEWRASGWAGARQSRLAPRQGPDVITCRARRAARLCGGRPGDRGAGDLQIDGRDLGRAAHPMPSARRDRARRRFKRALARLVSDVTRGFLTPERARTRGPGAKPRDRTRAHPSHAASIVPIAERDMPRNKKAPRTQPLSPNTRGGRSRADDRWGQPRRPPCQPQAGVAARLSPARRSWRGVRAPQARRLASPPPCHTNRLALIDRMIGASAPPRRSG